MYLYFDINVCTLKYVTSMLRKYLNFVIILVSNSFDRCVDGFDSSLSFFILSHLKILHNKRCIGAHHLLPYMIALCECPRHVHLLIHLQNASQFSTHQWVLNVYIFVMVCQLVDTTIISTTLLSCTYLALSERQLSYSHNVTRNASSLLHKSFHKYGGK